MSDGQGAPRGVAPVALTPAQLRSRRHRNLAVGLIIGALVVLFYVMTFAKLGGQGVVSTPN